MLKSSAVVLSAALVSLAALSVPAAAQPSQAGHAGQAGHANKAAPAVTTKLPGFADIVTDPVHGHVFVSTGAANSVVVTDSDTVVVTTLSDLAGAAGMVLSPDSSTLYVALPASDAIEAIDTVTFDSVAIETGDGTCPTSLAISAGALWFGYGCASDDGDLGAVDLTGGSVHTGLIDPTYTGGGPLVAASAELDGTLFVAATDESGDLSRYDVTGGQSPTATRGAHQVAGSSLRDLAITPDGSTLLVAAYNNQALRRFSTADLAPSGNYASGVSTVAVSVRPDGMVAAGRLLARPSVTIFKPGYQGHFAEYQIARSPYDAVPAGGLAFGNTRLFAVAGRPSGGHFSLSYVLPKHTTTVTVRTDKATYDYDASATVTAHLGYTAISRFVTISAQSYGGSDHVVRRARVDLHGNLVAHVRVFKRTTFTASFAGDLQSTSDSASVTRQVRARVSNSLSGWYGHSGVDYLYHVNVDPVLTATVVPRVPGTCVIFRGQYYDQGHWTTFGTTKCVRLDDTSRAAVRLTGTHYVGERDRLRAEWATHPANLGALGPWQTFRFTAGSAARGAKQAAVRGLAALPPR